MIYRINHVARKGKLPREVRRCVKLRLSGIFNVGRQMASTSPFVRIDHITDRKRE